MRVDWCVSSWFRIKNTHSLKNVFYDERTFRRQGTRNGAAQVVTAHTKWSTGRTNSKEKKNKNKLLCLLQKERKKENRQPKGGMGGRHAVTTQGF